VKRQGVPTKGNGAFLSAEHFLLDKNMTGVIIGTNFDSNLGNNNL
jgi:hypothetical protein